VFGLFTPHLLTRALEYRIQSSSVQVPYLAETVIRPWLLRRLFSKAMASPLPPAEVERHVAAFEDFPGAMRAAVAYYQAAVVGGGLVAEIVAAYPPIARVTAR
jgi:hypothetical protein